MQRLISVLSILCLGLSAAAQPAAESFDRMLARYNNDRSMPLDVKESSVQDHAGVQVHDLTYANPLGWTRARVLSGSARTRALRGCAFRALDDAGVASQESQ